MTRHKLVRDYDRAHCSERVLEITDRPAQTTLICLECRRVPDRAAYRDRWLKAHPLPRRWCQTLCYASNSFSDRADHKRWHLELHVSNNMPRFETYALAFKCPDCGGTLVSVTW